MIRFRTTTLFTYQEEEINTSNSLCYFLDLEQIIWNTNKVTCNNIVKSIRFDPLLEELFFQNRKVQHKISVNLDNHY